MPKLPDMHEDDVREMLSDLRHFDAYADIGDAANMIDKAATAIDLLLRNRRDNMLRIAYLEGQVEGMGYMSNPFAELLNNFDDGEDEMDDEDELDEGTVRQ
jgi:hypothetical protein